MRARLEFTKRRILSPVTRYVHFSPDQSDAWYTVASKAPQKLLPPLPLANPTGQFPVWYLEHKGNELFFVSVNEIEHVIDVFSQRILPSPRVLGAKYSAVNSHWLSRLHKVWKPWATRQQATRKLSGFIDEN